MIIIEMPQKTVESEIAALKAMTLGPNVSLVRKGALLALEWLRHGGDLPSIKIGE